MFPYPINLILLGWISAVCQTLSGNDLLTTCKFPMHALDDFHFHPIARGEAMNVFREIISAISQVQLNVEIPSSFLEQK